MAIPRGLLQQLLLSRPMSPPPHPSLLLLVTYLSTNTVEGRHLASHFLAETRWFGTDLS